MPLAGGWGGGQGRKHPNRPTPALVNLSPNQKYMDISDSRPRRERRGASVEGKAREVTTRAAERTSSCKAHEQTSRAGARAWGPREPRSACDEMGLMARRSEWPRDVFARSPTQQRKGRGLRPASSCWSAGVRGKRWGAAGLSRSITLPRALTLKSPKIAPLEPRLIVSLGMVARLTVFETAPQNRNESSIPVHRARASSTSSPV